MVTGQEIRKNSAKVSMMGTAMKIMGVMMGFCLGGTVLAATARVLGMASAGILAAAAGIAFAVVSLRYQQVMGVMMALCCGAGVLVAATPSLGLAWSLVVAIPVGAVIGIGSHKLMQTGHSH